MGETSFGTADYAVFLLLLLISSSIGLWVRFTGGRQKTTSEFLFADGQMSAVPLAFSLMASFMSAVSLLGLSAESYTYGSHFVVINIAYALVTPIIIYLFMPVYFNLGIKSANEYLEKRFGKVTRLCSSVIYCIQMILYMSVALYAPALALEAVTGMPKLYAILTVGLVCTFYSTIGGLKAVIFTDVFQSLLMFAAIFCIIIVAWVEKGSLGEIWHIAKTHHRIEFDNFNIDPTVRHSWWSLIFGGGVTYLSIYATNQGQIQRYLSAGKLKTAQNSCWLNLPIISLLSVSTSFAGLAIFSKYARCDPFASCKISKSDQLMPHYVVDTMKHLPGLSGLFVSGIFSAALSSVSASINSLAAVTIEDYVKPIYKRLKGLDFPEERSSYAKLISVMYGLVSITFAFMVDHLGGVLQASLTILGVVGGPTLGLFSLGMFFPQACEIGALSGFVASLAFTFWLGFSEKPLSPRLPVYVDGCPESKSGNLTILLPECTSVFKPERSSEYFYLFRISYLWLCVLGLTICLLIGILASLITTAIIGKSKKGCDPRMFAPPIASYLCRKQISNNNNSRKRQGDDIQLEKMAQDEESSQSLTKSNAAD